MVADDDPAMCEYLRGFLERRGYEADLVHSGDEAVRRFEHSPPAAVILDLVMPGSMDGLTALAHFRRIDRNVPIVVLSGQGRTATVVQAMKLGAIDFVAKPFEDADLDIPLANAVRQRQLWHDVAHLREQLQGEARQTLLYGRSERMVQVRELIDRVADTDLPVLICGESGTGKELVARAIYSKSGRADRPFVKVNCSALAADLLETELFGFERGAVAGAIQHKPGKFEFANHGTLFLDEIAGIGTPLQAKLLQVLQDGKFCRLGGKTVVPVDVRLLAATGEALDGAAASGGFRQDLLEQLNVVTIDLPPLRERREEVPELTSFFVKKYSVHYNKPLVHVSPATMRTLVDHDWPGNVRELENLAKRIVVLGSEAMVARDLHQAIAVAQRRAAGVVSHHPVSASAPAPAPLADIGAGAPLAVAHVISAHTAALPTQSAATAAGPVERYSLKDVSRHAAREAERELILRMLQHTRWNRKEAAEILGISYKALLYKIKENGLDRAS
jgi:DNA-binding NtrC family response regulator